MAVLFSMVDGQRDIPCAVNTSAMDDLQKLERTTPNQRDAQFMRWRDQIEERACKFLVKEKEFEDTPPASS
jgi:acyl-CoA reductase-like NAD-dependent aldehyde dehydrogenase